MVIAVFFALLPPIFHTEQKVVALICSSPTILDLVVNVIYGLQRWRNQYLKAEVMANLQLVYFQIT